MTSALMCHFRITDILKASAGQEDDCEYGYPSFERAVDMTNTTKQYSTPGQQYSTPGQQYTTPQIMSAPPSEQYATPQLINDVLNTPEQVCNTPVTQYLVLSHSLFFLHRVFKEICQGT